MAFGLLRRLLLIRANLPFALPGGVATVFMAGVVLDVGSLIRHHHPQRHHDGVAWGSGEAGREIEGPMAWVILGGLVTSSGLNLFVLPVLYRRLG
jgi:Cu/Ag efflux pump CusA